MTHEGKLLQKILAGALIGKGAHAATKNLFEGLDWKAAGSRPRGSKHSVYQLLWHMNYWQDWALVWLKGGKPRVPRHASASWPAAAPANARAWQRAVRDFRAGLEQMARESRRLDLLAKRGPHTRLGMLHVIATHNSYHAGQVVVLRQMMGKRPPRSGGVTR